MGNSPLVNYTKLSPNHSGKRNHAIDRISPHCVVGQCSVETLGNIFAPTSIQASSNYGIGPDGRVGMYVEEKNRSWCTSSSANDNRAVTIECASDTTHPYAMKDAVYNKLIDLCVDICQRNGKTKLLWFNDKVKALAYNPKPTEMVLTVHRWFANKSCPGDWLYSRLGKVAEEVTKRLGQVIRNKVIAVCNQEVGTGAPTGDDKYIQWFNKNVLKTGALGMSVPWAHIFASYAGFNAGLTGNEIPLTANCDEGMNWFKNRKQWKDAAAYGGKYIPEKGDMVYYSSTHNQNDSTHVGWVTDCDGTLMVAIEGDKSGKVDKRTIYLSDAYILGYGIINYPDKAEENKSATSNKLAGTGIGTAVALVAMNVRSGASTAHGRIGGIDKGKSVEVLGKTENNWLKIVWDIAPEGYAYVCNTEPYFNVTWKETSYKPKENYVVGDIVQFKGNTHYISANTKKGSSCRPGKAKITQITKGDHPYHLIATDDGGSSVYGWVDASTITPLAQSGYSAWVGKVTASVLNVRTGAGTKYGKLQAWPQLNCGNLVDVLGEVKATDGSKWYYVNIQGNKGYVHSAYITKA